MRGGSSFHARRAGPRYRGHRDEGPDVPHPPEVLAMILCDQVITDVQTNKKSLIGIFDQIETASLPCLIHELHIYLSLTDGHGRLPMAVTCVADDGGDELFRGDSEVEFSDPLQVVEIQFIFPNCAVPPGRRIPRPTVGPRASPPRAQVPRRLPLSIGQGVALY